MSLHLDTSEFEREMRNRVKLLGKNAAKELNKRAGDVALRAIKLTPKASRPAIERDLKRVQPDGGRLEYRLINLYRRTGSFGASFRRVPRWLSNIGTGPPLSGREMGDASHRLVAQAKSSAGYVAVGWAKVAAAFGKNVRLKVSDKGYAGKSSATKATEGSLTAILENATRGADVVGSAALQQAVDSVAADMQAHTAAELFKGVADS